MKNEKIINGKMVSNTKRNANEEFKSLSGCLKALCEMDNLTSDNKLVLRYLGIKKGTTNKERGVIAETIYNNTPYCYYDSKGVKHPADRKRVIDENGEKITLYTNRTTWTFSKIIDCAKIVVGDRVQEVVVVTTKEE